MLFSAAEEGGFPRSLLSEDLLRDYVDLLVRLVEAVGALIIFVGALLAAVGFVRAAFRRKTDREFVRVRLGLGRYLTLGLEFQLASDVLSTAIAPTFSEIGKLAAIAAIRTALNYLLAREIARERAEVERSDAPSAEGARSDGRSGGPAATAGRAAPRPTADGLPADLEERPAGHRPR